MFRINVESGQINELANVPFPFDTGVLIGQCGSATRADGSQVVVFAGGVEAPNDISSNIAVTTSYIYDVDGDFWTPGPSLPEPRTWGRAVQYQNTFVIVGGGDDFFGDPSSFVSSIVRYDPDGQEWEEAGAAAGGPGLRQCCPHRTTGVQRAVLAIPQKQARKITCVLKTWKKIEMHLRYGKKTWVKKSCRLPNM